jgi:hypothetical protein
LAFFDASGNQNENRMKKVAGASYDTWATYQQSNTAGEKQAALYFALSILCRHHYSQ